MIPQTLVGLANLQRRRRGETVPREPFRTLAGARQALTEADVAIGGLTAQQLPALAQLAGAVAELAECLALQQPPSRGAVRAINELASGSTGVRQLSVTGRAIAGEIVWRASDPVAALASRVIDEVTEMEVDRLSRCQRGECDLLFFDSTRSRSQRWHAENPCGWLQRQQQRRLGLSESRQVSS